MPIAAIVLGCSPDPVEWSEPMPLAAELSASPYFAFDPQGRLTGRPAQDIAHPVFTGQCAGSVRMSRDTTGDWYAVWWSIRADSTADIVVSRSTDGVVWSPPIRVDSTDVGHIGCRRPPPSIAADAGTVHVAYAMAAREGPGIFASHSMDRGMMFHTPVAVVYGERPGGGLTAIDARGDHVAVAYDDPNSAPPRVGLALSRSMAHLFEWRGTVSPQTGPARAPGVALGDGRIAVTWAGGDANDASAPRAVRLGVLR